MDKKLDFFFYGVGLGVLSVQLHSSPQHTITQVNQVFYILIIP